MIQDNISRIRQGISSICKDLGRNPDEIILIGVTKYAEAALIKEAVEAGLEHIGENRVQDAIRKFPILEGVTKQVTKHMIGHLQTNKVKQAVECFDMIQSVDNLKLAQEIDKRAAKLNKAMDILIQVNVAGEEQKFGLSPKEAPALVEAILGLKHIRNQGFMTIAPLSDEEQVVRSCFRGLRALKDEIILKIKPCEQATFRYLSMGMSGDYRIALEEGANMIRIGSAIFKDE